MPLHAQVSGDVLCLQFDEDDDVALFVPGSSDVLLCAKAAWDGMAKSGPGSEAVSSTGSFDESSVNQSDPALALKAALVKLGACLG